MTPDEQANVRHLVSACYHNLVIVLKAMEEAVTAMPDGDLVDELLDVAKQWAVETDMENDVLERHLRLVAASLGALRSLHETIVEEKQEALAAEAEAYLRNLGD